MKGSGASLSIAQRKSATRCVVAEGHGRAEGLHCELRNDVTNQAVLVDLNIAAM